MVPFTGEPFPLTIKKDCIESCANTSGFPSMDALTCIKAGRSRLLDQQDSPSRTTGA